MKYKLKELMDVNRWSSPRPIISFLSDKGYRWLKISDFKLFDRYVYDTKEHIIEDGVKKTRYLSKGTLVLTNSATPGIPIFLGNDMCLHDGFLYFQNINEKIINIKFLYYWFLFNRGKIISQANGSVFQNLKKEIVENFIIDVPNIKVQFKIVKILENINNKIELNNQINDNLHEEAELLFQAEFVDNKNENFTWHLYKLDEIFYHITPGTNYQPKRIEKGIPFLNVRNISNGYIDYSDAKFITKEDYKNVHKTWTPEENDLLISRIGTLGIVAVIRKEDLPLAVHYNFLDLKTNKIPFQFGYFLLKSDYFQKKYKYKTKQSVQEYVTVDDIRNIEVEIPNNDKIFDKYIALYNKIQNLQRQNRSLEQLRDTLLPKLMNGEIDLDKLEI